MENLKESDESINVKLISSKFNNMNRSNSCGDIIKNSFDVLYRDSNQIFQSENDRKDRNNERKRQRHLSSLENCGGYFGSNFSQREDCSQSVPSHSINYDAEGVITNAMIFEKMMQLENNQKIATQSINDNLTELKNDILGHVENRITTLKSELVIQIQENKNKIDGNFKSVNDECAQVKLLCSDLKREVDEKFKTQAMAMSELSTENGNLKSQCKQLEMETKSLKSIAIEHSKVAHKIDLKERAGNFIIYGMNGVEEKRQFISCLFRTIEVNVTNFEFKMVGKKQDFCLVTLLNDDIKYRDVILRKSVILKKPESESERNSYEHKIALLTPFGIDVDSLNLKKDLHPTVRSEWRRLNEVVRSETSKPENIGETITLDPKKREVLKNGVVIDSWRANFY